MERIAEDGDVRIDRLTLGVFGTNSYILTCPRTGDSVLVDAPAEASSILKALEGTTPRYILMTHNHFDHTGALTEVQSRLKIPVGAHRLDAPGLPLKPDILFEGGETISCGDMGLKVMHTPGHTAGSLCFFAGKHLISGDTIFPGGPGKTGSPAHFTLIIEAITSKIFVLPDETAVYPGHGDYTVLRKEKEEYAIFSSRSHDRALCGDVLWLSP